jgi:hypothetical protein
MCNAVLHKVLRHIRALPLALAQPFTAQHTCGQSMTEPGPQQSLHNVPAAATGLAIPAAPATQLSMHRART